MKSQLQSLLEKDHESLDQLLHELDAEVAAASPRAIQLLDLFWARLAMHIRAEHLHLFPTLTEADPTIYVNQGLSYAQVQKILATLRSDHDFFMKELAELMKIARAAFDDVIVDEFKARLAAIRNRLAAHNQIEEQQVYSWPALLCDNATIVALHDRLRKELENLPPRLKG